VPPLHTCLARQETCTLSQIWLDNNLMESIQQENLQVIPLLTPVLAGELFAAGLVGENIVLEAGAAVETCVGYKQFNLVSCQIRLPHSAPAT